MVAGDGGISTFGARNFHGSTGDIKLNKPLVFTFGGVEFLGSIGVTKLNSPVLDLIN